MKKCAGLLFAALCVFLRGDTKAQTCIGLKPMLNFYDPVTGQEIQSLNFGNVQVGQVKTMQVIVRVSPSSPCGVEVIQTAHGGVEFKSVPLPGGR